eukprot:64056_1
MEALSQPFLFDNNSLPEEKEILNEELPMTMEEIREWNPKLEPILTKINNRHKKYINWIDQIDEIREGYEYTKYKYINGDNVINIYKRKTHTAMKRMRCNICHTYQHIADTCEPPRCAMAIKFGGTHFDFDIMNHHFENPAHKNVQRYILMMQYKDKLLQHEFGGSDHIVRRLKEIIAKMFDETDKQINLLIYHNINAKDSFSHLPKPPLYPFDKASVAKVAKRLSDALAFSVNQNEFIEDIIFQAMEASKIEPKKEDTFNIIPITSVLSELSFINNALHAVLVARPVIMRNLCQALNRQKTSEDHKYDTKHIIDVLDSTLKTTKTTIINDIMKIKQLKNYKMGNNAKLHSNIEISLLFDIYSVYRIHQYVNKGKFDTSIADLRERCGGYKDRWKERPIVDNGITMNEATMFQNLIRYYINNIVQPIKLNKSCVINGDVQQYMIYIFAMSTCLKQLFEKQKNQEQKSDIGDIQFDMVLIAKSSINIFTGKELHNQVISGLDIKTNLETVGIKTFVKHEISDEDSTDRKKITDKISIMFKSLALKLGFDYDNINEKLNNKRFVLLIDKRRINNNNDILYLYESMEYIEKIENNNSIGLDNDGVMHWLCEKYLIPKSDGTWIGSMKSMDGYLFTYSFHIHGYNTYRCYLYFNGGCTRTFPEHFVELIPKYFMYPIHDQKFKKDFKKEFIKILYSHDYKHGFDLILTDNIFTEYYRIITGLYHITVNYRRV